MKVISANGVFDLGVTEATPTISIRDYSRRETDDFGETTVVPRGFSRKLSVKLLVPSDRVDAIQQHLASLRAQQATWQADATSEWLSPVGFFRDFEIDLAGPPTSFCTLSIEGLAETEIAADPGGDPAPIGSSSTLRLIDDGATFALGLTEASPTVGIKDYSRKDFDDFGEPDIVERAWAKRMSVQALIRTDMIDVVANRLAAVRARPVLWQADAQLQSLQVEGFFKEFSIERGENVSKLSLSIEGISQAAPVGPGGIRWVDILDTDPTKPKPEDGATNGATLPEPGSGETGNLQKPGGAPWLANELANRSLLLRPAKDGFAIGLPGGDLISEIRTVDTGAVEASALAVRDRHLAEMGERIIEVLAQRRTIDRTFRDAGIVTDPASGKARLFAIEATEEKLTELSITVDAQRGLIEQRATTTYVDSAIAAAVLDPSQVPVFGQLDIRIGEAEQRLDAAEAAINQRATLIQLTAATGRITTAEQRLDAVEGLVQTKVESVEFDQLADRVTTAQQDIEALGDAASIRESVTAATYLPRNQREADERAVMTLAQLRATDREAAAAVASARRELTALTNDGLSAEAQARQVLAVRQAQLEATAILEQIARLAGDQSLAQTLAQVSTRTDQNEVSVGLLLASENANEGRFLLAVNANGQVIGIEGFGNTDGTNGLVFRSNVLAFVPAEGGDPQPFFVSTPQGTTINNAFLRNAQVAPNPLSTIFLPVQLEPLRVRGSHGNRVEYDSGRTFGKNPVRIEADLTGLPALPAGSYRRFRPTQVGPVDFVPELVVVSEGGEVTARQSAAGTDQGAGVNPRWQTDKPTAADARDQIYEFTFGGTLAKIDEYYVNDGSGGGAPGQYEPTVPVEGGQGGAYYATYQGTFVLRGRTAAGWIDIETVTITDFAQNTFANPATLPFSKTAAVQSGADLADGAGTLGIQPTTGSVTSFAGVRYETESGGAETPVTTPVTFIVHPPR